MNVHRIGFLVILCVAGTAFGQNPKDPATKNAKEIAAKEARIKTAEEELKKADQTLQGVYARFEQLFKDVAGGNRLAVTNELRRIFEEPAKEAHDALGATVDAAALGRAKKAFERGLAKWVPKLEVEALSVTPQRVKEVALATLERTAAGGAADITAKSLAEKTVEAMFSDGTEFAPIWNAEVAKKRPETKTFADAAKTLEKLRQELAVLRDPKLEYVMGAPAGMARIPEGNYGVEGLYGFPKKRRSVNVKAFYIDLYEVSNEEYWKNYYANLTDPAQLELRVPKDKKRKPLWPLNPQTKRYEPAPEAMKLPVVGLDVDAALAYAASQKKRLPTDAEWVAAASAVIGSDLEYPWGKDYQPGLCNDKRAEQGQTMPVDAFPDGRSFFGVYNMSGNVREWTATSEGTGKDFTTIDKLPAGENVVVRGGGFRDNPPREVSIKWRWGLLPMNTHEEDLGFRCAKDIGEEK